MEEVRSAAVVARLAAFVKARLLIAWKRVVLRRARLQLRYARWVVNEHGAAWRFNKAAKLGGRQTMSTSRSRLVMPLGTACAKQGGFPIRFFS